MDHNREWTDRGRYGTKGNTIILERYKKKRIKNLKGNKEMKTSENVLLCVNILLPGFGELDWIRIDSQPKCEYAVYLDK